MGIFKSKTMTRGIHRCVIKRAVGRIRSQMSRSVLRSVCGDQCRCARARCLSYPFASRSRSSRRLSTESASYLCTDWSNIAARGRKWDVFESVGDFDADKKRTRLLVIRTKTAGRNRLGAVRGRSAIAKETDLEPGQALLPLAPAQSEQEPEDQSAGTQLHEGESRDELSAVLRSVRHSDVD